MTRRRRGESKRERPIQPVIISLNVLHNPGPSEKFTDLHREEKGEGGDRVDLGEKRESEKRREK